MGVWFGFGAMAVAVNVPLLSWWWWLLLFCVVVVTVLVISGLVGRTRGLSFDR